jgi:hypothetical protein
MLKTNRSIKDTEPGSYRANFLAINGMNRVPFLKRQLFNHFRLVVMPLPS